VRLFLALALVAGAGAGAARADLYRWVDPQTGSVKFSSEPPPASQSGVELVPYRGSAAPARPAAPAVASGSAALDLRWRELLAEISAAPAGSPMLQQRLQAFAAVGAELDRLDPAGAPPRRAETEAVLQRLLKAEGR
jgi:hypothetical protein